ncbi:SusC/RagA family TonB-linked outer membrane protein [Chitinophaga sancti]|uniref:SusC/RagA family TonB-linked outer membrane protein n=1 Tax=Chitinophaga sancti TaxID=1004 RepID=UPI002A759D9B|nr:SusC/RagA family TonB-linked outer membrane protein [Chitinophaga sancti]WPQ63344.1 SusC/RagA family TonB-linked outer membrane protein [Chitinophaga sancti]
MNDKVQLKAVTICKIFICLIVSLIGLGIKAQAFVRDNDAKIIIHEKSVREILKMISQRTGIMFTYSNAQFDDNRIMSINFSNVSLDSIVRYVINGTGCVFTYSHNKNIVIFKNSNFKENQQLEPIDSLITLAGRVMNDKGQPIPGATILIKGRRIGTGSDDDGRFILQGVVKNSIIIISSVGYVSQEILVRGFKWENSIILKDYIPVLDETIVEAYSVTSTRKIVGGGISVIRSEDIEKRPVTNPLLSLQAAVPGITIEQSTGISNTGIKVEIRGKNSLAMNSSPLYVIDGVPYTSQLLPSINNVLGESGSFQGTLFSGNPMSFINPSDIESISVLKDADATSIYGSRAASGAILITTKKGKNGATKININFQNGWGKVGRRLNLLNKEQYLEIRHEGLNNDNASISTYDYDLNGNWDTTRYTDWQKVLLGGTAKYLDTHASISGGNSNTQILVGAGYHAETSIFPGKYLNQKGSLHFNIYNSTNNQRFRSQLSGNYMVDNNNIPSSDLTNLAVTLSPIAPPLYTSDGALNWQPDKDGNSTWSNPLAYLYTKSNIKTYNLISNLLLIYQIKPNFTIKSNFGYTNLRVDEFNSTPLKFFPPEYLSFLTGSATFRSGIINSWIIEPQINYDLKIDKYSIGIIAGGSLQNNNSQQQVVYADGYTSDLQIENISSAPRLSSGSTIASIYKYNGVFGRINYNFSDRYLFNFSVRRDGSSRFGEMNLFNNFWSVAGAWLFSGEKFIANYSSVISFGKLRASYGTSGNDQIGDYQFLNLYSRLNVPVPYQGTVGLAPNGLSNPYLQWEETKKMQFGLDLGLFKDRIYFSGNYYENRSSNQLVTYLLPSITGFNGVTKNFPATIQNLGWELSLNTQNVISNEFNWSTSLNVTIPKNKLISFPNLSNTSYASTYVIGQPINLVRAFEFEGVNNETGLYQFKDSHGGSTSSPSLLDDRSAIMKVAPKFYGGVQNTLKFKRFQFDILFQFVNQNSSSNVQGNRPGSFSGGQGNQPTSVLSRWRKPGDNTSIQKFSSSYSSDVSNAYYSILSSNFVYGFGGSYIRLKNLSLSWEAPSSWCVKSHLQGLKLYAHAQNLLTITNYIGLDPETKSSSSLPPLRMVTLGLQVNL